MNMQIVSEELFAEALRTLPWCPNYSLIGFTAHGGSIIPNSEIRIEYDQATNEFRPKGSVYFTEESSENVPNLIKGGKMESIIVGISTDYFPGEEMFTKFRDFLLPKITDNGYNISSGELWLKVKYLSRYKGHSIQARLEFGKKEEVSELGLEISPGLNREEKETLTGWFNGLYQKSTSK